MKNIVLTTALAVLVIFGLSACGSYYKVIDPASDKTYYTKDIDEKESGAIQIKDANTGSTVTLQNSEVTEINEEEFRANTNKEK